ncbi:amino acid ABC transporter permease [Papillibacter cinnamivorans]|uniref:Polar amino acid transport system permease protein n=1 Tax=Papillibacter cinnamivorans DSM 12816 TaxID=1122930 RepID=A0A1W2CQU3_9FIRM|nr:amino acid ABC transporter permease [Papillibacter cinnamivorans]SMC87635.1 polar amino acid transport system permease protein [Papillibacter cinnamivorans DSM 12816]
MGIGSIYAVCALTFAEKLYQGLIYADRWKLYLEGLGYSLQITLGAIVLGTVLGIVFCLLKISTSRILRFIANVYIDVVRGTPVVVQLLLVYFVILSSPDTSKLVASVLAFGINSGAYVAEIIRAGINSVDPGQMEAGRSLGLSRSQAMRFIILPQAIKNSLPTYASEFIVLIKETAVAGYIGMQDLTKMSSTIISRTYESSVPLITVALIYLAITLGLSKLFAHLERRMNVGDRR